MPDTPTLLERLREERSAAITEWETLISARETERETFEARSDATDEDRTAFTAAEETFRAASESHEAEILALDERIRVQENLAERRAEAGAAVTGDRVTSDPLTYRQDNGQEHSYFRDLAVVSNSQAAGGVRSTSLPKAQERLFRHAAEMDVEMPKRAAAREARATKRLEEAEASFRQSVGVNSRGLDFSPFERRTNPNRTDGQGGYFVPPLWLIDEYVPGLRAGRVAADLARQMPLPEGTDSINIPALSTLTTTAVQTADNAGVSSTDFTDAVVTAGVKTIAGQEDVAIQLLDQTPGQIMDTVILEDLAADYNKRLDLQALAGSNANGQIKGLYSSAGASGWTGYNTVTYTQASPVPTDFFSVFGAMASQVAATRFRTNNLQFVVHPRRGFWFVTGLDSNKRPLVESAPAVAFNPMGIEEQDVAQGLIAQLPFGPNVHIDANVTVTDTAGSGSNQDVAIGAIWDDCWLFEGEQRVRVLPEILSGTLQVRFQLYNYVAFLVRYGASIAIASGSGFAAPTGAVSSVAF